MSAFGVVVVLFSAILPLAEFNLSYEDSSNYYFRGIIIGATIIALSLPALIENIVIKSILNAVAGGLLSLLYYSTVNYFCECKDLDKYFSLTFKIIIIGLPIIIISRLWIRPSGYKSSTR